MDPIKDDISQALDVSSEMDVAVSTITYIKGHVVPEGALRVRILNEKGKSQWRKVTEVLPSDTIELGASGQPQWMRNQIGRPLKTKGLHEELPPINPLVGDLIRVKEAGMRSDPIILVAEANPQSSEVLDQCVLGIAEEAASLRFERQEAERQGLETSVYSMRRVASLKSLADTWIKRKEQIQNQTIDLDSPAFQAVFQFISETYARAMAAASVRPELADSVVAQFAKLLDDEWKNEAKSRMSGEE